MHPVGQVTLSFVKERRHLRHDHAVFVQRALHERLFVVRDVVPFGQTFFQRARSEHRLAGRTSGPAAVSSRRAIQSFHAVVFAGQPTGNIGTSAASICHDFSRSAYDRDD